MLKIFANNKQSILGGGTGEHAIPWTRTAFYNRIAMALRDYNPKYRKNYNQIGPKLRIVTNDMLINSLPWQIAKTVDVLGIRNDLLKLFSLDSVANLQPTRDTSSFGQGEEAVQQVAAPHALTEVRDKKRRSSDDAGESFTLVELARQENKKRKLEYATEKLNKEFECRQQDAERQFRQREKQLDMQQSLEMARVASTQTALMEMQQTIKMQQQTIQDLMKLLPMYQPQQPARAVWRVE